MVHSHTCSRFGGSVLPWRVQRGYRRRGGQIEHARRGIRVPMHQHDSHGGGNSSATIGQIGLGQITITQSGCSLNSTQTDNGCVAFVNSTLSRADRGGDCLMLHRNAVPWNKVHRLPVGWDYHYLWACHYASSADSEGEDDNHQSFDTGGACK